MSLYDGLKDAIKFAKNAGYIEIMQKLIDVQQQVHNVQSENQKLREENEALKNRIDSEKELRIFEGFLYNIKADLHNRGPFCQSCWEEPSKAH